LLLGTCSLFQGTCGRRRSENYDSSLEAIPNPRGHPEPINPKIFNIIIPHQQHLLTPSLPNRLKPQSFSHTTGPLQKKSTKRKNKQHNVKQVEWYRIVSGRATKTTKKNKTPSPNATEKNKSKKRMLLFPPPFPCYAAAPLVGVPFTPFPKFPPSSSSFFMSSGGGVTSAK
jgi:hypothetical protein